MLPNKESPIGLTEQPGYQDNKKLVLTKHHCLMYLIAVVIVLVIQLCTQVQLLKDQNLLVMPVGTGVTDTVIDQPLKYLTIANVGDIVFDNNLYVDTFVYVNGTVSATKNIDTGTVRQYNTISTFDKLLGWQTSFETNTQRQSFSFDYTGVPLVLDIAVLSDTSKIPVKVFVEGQFVLPNTYTYATNSDNVTVITFNPNVVRTT